MLTYVIIFDLPDSSPIGVTDIITRYLKGFSEWAKPAPNAWLVSSPKPITLIRDELKNLTLFPIKYLVIAVNGDAWASSHMTKEINDWLGTHL